MGARSFPQLKKLLETYAYILSIKHLGGNKNEEADFLRI